MHTSESTLLKILSSLAVTLISAAFVAAFDLEYCHGGVNGTCKGLTFQAEPICFITTSPNATVGAIDTVIGLKNGLQYVLHTGRTGGNISATFGIGTNELVDPFLNNVLAICGRIPATWTSFGCYTDDTLGQRTLAAASLVDDGESGSGMTIERCLAFCDSDPSGREYVFAGVEFGTECYCDYSIQYPGIPISDNETLLESCNTIPCSGNVSETCGGASSITIYTSGRDLPFTPVEVLASNGQGSWYQGCYTDDINDRTLSFPVFPTLGVQIQTCINACLQAGANIAGVEYGIECWCGTTLNPNATKVDDAQCAQACADDTYFLCGGSSRLNVYALPSLEE